MILVLGNDPRRVELADIGDAVYFKQQKSFSEAQYARSRDLQKAISKGSLTVLSRVPEKDGNFFAPETQPTVAPMQDTRIDVLLSKIASLESALLEKQQVVAPTKESTEDIDRRVDDLEQRISQAGSSGFVAEVLTALKRLEEKVAISSRDSNVFDRLESILSRAPGAVSDSPPEAPRRVEDVYVPNIMVEDANAHIKLDTRVIEKSDSMDDALSALKKMKQGQ